MLLWFTTPDEWVGWIPSAVLRGWQLARREGPAAIFATGPPFSVVVAGALVSRATRVPLVADFRDAWTLDPADPIGCVGGPFVAPLSRRRKSLLVKMESWVLRTSAHVLFTSDTTRAEYCRVFPFLAEKSSVLYNGAEREDFRAVADQSLPFAFNYVGTLHPFQCEQVVLFLRGYREALARQPGISVSRIRFFGHRAPAVEAILGSLVLELGLSDQVILGGIIGHDLAVAIMKSRGVNLLFAGQSLLTRLSKISDALAVCRPMLAFALSESETAHHVRRAGQTSYGGAESAEVADLLIRLWSRHRCDPPDAPDAFPFDENDALHWKASAMALDRILRAVATRG